MDNSALESLIKKEIAAIEIKAEVINSLVPSLTEKQKEQLRKMADDLSPYLAKARQLIANGQAEEDKK